MSLLNYIMATFCFKSCIFRNIIFTMALIRTISDKNCMGNSNELYSKCYTVYKIHNMIQIIKMNLTNILTLLGFWQVGGDDSRHSRNNGFIIIVSVPTAFPFSLPFTTWISISNIETFCWGTFWIKIQIFKL